MGLKSGGLCSAVGLEGGTEAGKQVDFWDKRNDMCAYVLYLFYFSAKTVNQGTRPRETFSVGLPCSPLI